MVAMVAITLVLLAATDGSNSCITCHAGVVKNDYVAYRFRTWNESRHAKAGIGCENCHGGDSTSSDPAKAHAGILRSTDIRSKVYYTNLPQTCGRCHQAEYAAFRRSSHFARLAINQPGPSCNSCHWEMGSLVPARGDYQAVCRSCHNASGLAANLLTQPLLAENIMLRLQVIELRLRTLRPATTEEAKHIIDLRTKLQIAQKLWHTFNIPGLKSLSDRMASELESLRFAKAQTETKAAKGK